MDRLDIYSRSLSGPRGIRLLALVTDAFGAYGGIAQYNRDFLTALAEMDEVQSIDVLPRIAPESFCASHKGLRIHKPVKRPSLYAINAFALCVRRRPDIIYNAHIYHGPLSKRLGILFGAKVVSQLHGTEIWSTLDSRHLEPLKSSHAVLCVSHDTAERYVAQAGQGINNSVVIPNTVADDYVPKDRMAARQKFGITNEFAILTVGRLDARNGGGYKGHERVLSALPSLELHERPVRYLIAGVGDDRARLESLTQDLGLDEKVTFLGKVPRVDLPDLYRAADLFAMPSTGEGFGIVFIEAMACGTPAIGLAIGGSGDALNGLGLAVSKSEFANAMRLAVNQAAATTCENRAELAKHTRHRFGRHKFSARVRTTLEELLVES